MNFTSVKKITIREGDVSNISLNGKVIWSAKGNLDLVNTFHFVSDTDNDVSMFKRIPHDEKWKGEYSLDEGATWTEVSFLQGGDRDPEVTMHMKAGDSLYIRSKGRESGGRLFAYGFRSTAPIYAYGNIWTLLSYYGKHSIDNTFAALFENMTTLITAPDVSASEYSGKYPRDCFSNTFNGCTGLKYIPPIKKVVDEKFEDNAFNRMFNKCTNLHEVEFDFDKWNTTIMGDWNSNAAGYGHVAVPESIQVGTGEGQIPQDSSKGLPVGWGIMLPKKQEDKFRFTNVGDKTCELRLIQHGGAPSVSLVKSKDGNVYESCNMYSGITLKPGETVYLKGRNYTFAMNDPNYFTSTQNVECHGSVMDLCDYGIGTVEIKEKNQFKGLFLNMKTLLTAPELPATTLTEGCYDSMFMECSSLIKAPKILPATTLTPRCYYMMFECCKSLTTAPELPATTLASQCYYEMFYGCDLLTIAPELPATTMYSQCYKGMFRGCDSLSTVPKILPAMTLAWGCYYEMFSFCKSLIQAPELPATTLDVNCYHDLFYSCEKLNYVKIGATRWYPIQTGWLGKMSSVGTIVKPKELQIGTGEGQIPLNSDHGIPTGWEVQNI